MLLLYTLYYHFLLCTSINIHSDAAGCTWILPRPKNMPPACFLSGLSNPHTPLMRNPPTRGGFSHWRRVRDSNPRFLSESLVFKTSSLNRSDNSPYGLNDSITHTKSQVIPWQMIIMIICEITLTNHDLYARILWQSNIDSFIRSDTQEAEGAPLLRE